MPPLARHRLQDLAGSARRRVAGPLLGPEWPRGLPRPEPPRRVGIDYDTEWSRRYPVRLARAALFDYLARPLVRAVASPAVVGAEALAEVPQPMVLAANHASHLDTPLVLSALPARLRHRVVVAAAADHFFDSTWKATLWSFAVCAIPIERHRIERRSAAQAVALIEQGWSLLIYPEGGRSPDGWGQAFRGGAAYVAKRTGAPVVPVHLKGTWELLGKGARGLRRAPTRVSFGPPLRPGPEEDARRFSARIEQAVAQLADEAASDWWQARQRAARGATPPLSGPPLAGWRRAWALGPARPPADRRWPEL
jgi:1-acyl-sn-glycerol-3-phosphate acyltransferase